MSPKQAKPNIVRGTTPPWQNKLLLALLFLSAIAGYAGSVYLALHVPSAIQSAAIQLNPASTELPSEESAPSILENFLPKGFRQPESEALTQVRDLFRTAIDNKQNVVPLSFQGTLAGNEGESAIAIINDELFAVGTEIQGVKILSISNRTLTLEYNGETKKIGVGETISVILN